MAKIFCEKSKQYIDQDNMKYSFTGQTRKVNNVRCAVLKQEGTNNIYLKPWDHFNFLVKKKGEENMYAKLNNQKVRTMIKDFYTHSYDEESFKEKITNYALEYKVAERTILSVINGDSWRHVTVNLIKQLESGNCNVIDNVIQAANKTKGKNKLSPNLAKFIVRDHILNKISIKQLSTKFLVSETSVRRVVTGKSFKEVTIPAIVELSNWK